MSQNFVLKGHICYSQDKSTLKVFEEILGKENVLQNELMSKHTTFKIGGAADWFLTPTNKKQRKTNKKQHIF